MSSVIANALKVGNAIELNGQMWKINSLNHVKPGKGGAFVQASMKNIKTGTKLDKRFRSDENVDKIRCEDVEAIFLFDDGSDLNFSLTDTFEQVAIPKSIIGDKVAFLEDSMTVKLSKAEEEIIDIKLPESVVCEVVSTQPKMKHQTVNASTKPAELNNGLTVIVPQFVSEGDKVLIKTEDVTYMERCK
ncbi:elongation factor P [Rickettsiales bacterium]|nr:elongation factor P [Rickettsiales bacterium]